MKKVWRMKHYSFEDFAKDGGDIPRPSGRVVPYNAKVRIEEFVSRFLDPLWDMWNRYCAERGLPLSGIGIGKAFIRKSVCDTLSGDDRNNYLGYTAEVYPMNGAFEEFVRFMTLWVKSPKVIFEKICITDTSCNIIFKYIHRNYSKEFVFDDKKM